MAFKTTISKSTRGGKFSRLSGAMAIKMARENNDPMYKKMKKSKDRYLEYKDKLRQKYGQKGKQMARKSRRG